jgi:hypothetical protein
MTIFIEKKVRGADENAWKVVQRLKRGNRTTKLAARIANKLRALERPECKHVYRLRCKNGHIKFPPKWSKWYPKEWRIAAIDFCKSLKRKTTAIQ